MVDMIATKGLTYGTRRLVADDAFTARNRRDARILAGIGKARYADGPAEPKKPAPAKQPGGDIKALREEYAAKFGKRPFNGWDAATLREKIEDGPAS